MGMLRLCRQCFVVFVLIIPIQAGAEIYVYEDENGVRHYTNTPTGKHYKLATLPRLNTPSGNASGSIDRGTVRRPSGAGNPARYDQHIEKAAYAHTVDPLLIKAIIKAESDFDQFATSSKGAQGLMQLMPATARDLRVANSYNAAQNINGGTRYFKKLLNAYNGDIARSLAAYNAGPGRVAKNGPLPRIKETLDYVQRVTRYYRVYQLNQSAGVSPKNRLQKLVTLN